MDHVIEVRSLTKKFRDLVAVDALNFTVSQGEVFGLLGPNGAGKTTALSMLCTILKPTSGTAYVNGYDITEHASQVRRSIGIVFQEPSIDDRLTGRENLEMHADLYGVPKREQKKRIEEVLQLVELSDKANFLMRTYSGGMRRRLEIARGLIHYPKVLFLDEPTIGLDPQTRGHIWKYIAELSDRENITIILTTHYMEEADSLCDRIAIIDHGKVVALDETNNLKESLEGGVISVRTIEIEKLSAKLKELEWVKESHVEDGEIKLIVKDVNAALPRVVETAANTGIRIESMSVHEPTLDDVFLHYTGKEIRSESADEYRGLVAIRRRAVR